MFCTNCGSKLEDGSKFCTSCGVQLSEDELPRIQLQPGNQKAGGDWQSMQPAMSAGIQSPYGNQPDRGVQPEQAGGQSTYGQGNQPDRGVQPEQAGGQYLYGQQPEWSVRPEAAASVGGTDRKNGSNSYAQASEQSGRGNHTGRKAVIIIIVLAVLVLILGVVVVVATRFQKSSAAVEACEQVSETTEEQADQAGNAAPETSMTTEANQYAAPAEEAQDTTTAPQKTLREILVDYLGSDTIVEFCECDFDRDGTDEAFALANMSGDTGNVYFVTYSGVETAIENNSMDPYGEEHNLLEFSDAAFYVIGKYSTTTSLSYVLGVQNGKWYLSEDISLKGSSLTQISGTDDLTYTQDAYDASTDGTGHTWKPYYLYWDGAFKEYGGIEITEEELLRCDGAGDILSAIVGPESHINRIFYRGNGIININIADGTNLQYATLQLTGTAVSLCTDDLNTTGEYLHSGVYDAALIPEIAVYPTEFPVEETADSSEDELLTWSDFVSILEDASLYAWSWYWDPSQYLSSTDTIPDTEGVTLNGVYAAVTAPGIHSLEDLREQSHQYFSYAAIEEMEKNNFYKEQNGKLYIGLSGGLGGDVPSEIYFDGCRLDGDTYRLDISEGYSTGESRNWSIDYIREDGEWVFDSPIQYLGVNPLPIYEGGNGSFILDYS